MDGGMDEDLQVDAHVLAMLPKIEGVVSMYYHGASAWAKTHQIEAELPSGELKSFFLKVSTGDHGRESLKGEYESTAALYAIDPDFTNCPLGWGTFRDTPDTHFYLCEFKTLSEDVPDAEPFCGKLAALHRDSVSPNGKFGFHVVTYCGALPQDNSYTDTWEEFFAKGLKHMLALNLKALGSSEIHDLAPAMFEKVIPRLLRPMETNGRSVKPSLVHGDLWYGNVADDLDLDKPVVFDPCCFYAHNEYEFGNWRQERNKFSRSYFKAYHTHIPKAYPEEDYDDRNALYTIRFELQAATLFPNVPSYREAVISEMKRLIEKHPKGFEGFVESGSA